MLVKHGKASIPDKRSERCPWRARPTNQEVVVTYENFFIHLEVTVIKWSVGFVQVLDTDNWKPAGAPVGRLERATVNEPHRVTNSQPSPTFGKIERHVVWVNRGQVRVC